MFESVGAGTAAEKVRVFVSYDREHDADLHDLIVEQASRSTSAFEISARSVAPAATDFWDEVLRQAIQAADQVIFLCGEHSDDSGRMGAELRIAQEEERPYTLLWGRREFMCKKPATAKPADAMYSWTSEILQTQILTLLRLSRTDERTAAPIPAKATPKAPPQGPG
jgi:hypothetical protein